MTDRNDWVSIPGHIVDERGQAWEIKSNTLDGTLALFHAGKSTVRQIGDQLQMKKWLAQKHNLV